MRVYCLKTLNKLSIYPLGNTPSAPSAFTSAFTLNAPTTGPNAPSNIPINTDIATNDTNITSVDSDNISFFSKFANMDIGSGGDNGEGNFII